MIIHSVTPQGRLISQYFCFFLFPAIFHLYLKSGNVSSVVWYHCLFIIINHPVIETWWSFNYLFIPTSSQNPEHALFSLSSHTWILIFERLWLCETFGIFFLINIRLLSKLFSRDCLINWLILTETVQTVLLFCTEPHCKWSCFLWEDCSLSVTDSVEGSEEFA